VVEGLNGGAERAWAVNSRWGEEKAARVGVTQAASSVSIDVPWASPPETLRGRVER
jgi:hypothetical protein